MNHFGIGIKGFNYSGTGVGSNHAEANKIGS